MRVRESLRSVLLSSDLVGTRYQAVARPLLEAQRNKCCYCELLREGKFDHLDHFRPKARADRRPGSAESGGYWWLAWSWANLLFSCATCNNWKRDHFPLPEGSVVLKAEEAPPGRENPLLIDPGADDPIDHIEFRSTPHFGKPRWVPLPRDGSAKGRCTIEVLHLDRPALLDLYQRHVEDMKEELDAGTASRVTDRWRKLVRRRLNPRQPFTALSYDALGHFFPADVRAAHQLDLPRPTGLLPAPGA